MPNNRGSQPRRGVALLEAAKYIGVGVKVFRSLMGRGLMPRPRLLESKRVWDLDEIDLYFEALPVDERPSHELAPPNVKAQQEEQQQQPRRRRRGSEPEA